GLGWLPDGRLQVVSMEDRRVLRGDAAGDGPPILQELVSLHEAVPFNCNDMLVDTAGRAYIGNFGFDYLARVRPRSTVLVRVDPRGTWTLAADDLLFPNGMVLSPDGNTLIVAETFGNRLTAFDVQEGGTL